MLGTARLLGQTTSAALVSLFLARYPLEGTRISLLAGVGFALLGGALSMLRLSPAGARIYSQHSAMIRAAAGAAGLRRGLEERLRSSGGP